MGEKALFVKQVLKVKHEAHFLDIRFTDVLVVIFKTIVIEIIQQSDRFLQKLLVNVNHPKITLN